MKYLITGASGYIGSNLLAFLSDMNEEVLALFHNRKPRVLSDNITVMQGDITDHLFVRSLPTDVDVIIHCAALLRDHGPKKEFLDVNYHATIDLCNHYKKSDLKQFIFLSHIPYERSSRFYYYAQTKKVAEAYLNDLFSSKGFPVTIIRPGNVFGPGSPVWVNMIIQSIKKNRIALIDKGKGIFYHTYIDHVIDAIRLTIGNQKAIGKTLNITDDDYSITWKQYFTDIASIIHSSPPKKNMSKTVALFISYLMLLRYALLKKSPELTPAIVHSLTANDYISIEKSKEILGYEPAVSYQQAIEEIKYWWNNKNR